MNRDQIQGKWEQLKGKAKQLWGDLTDDDFLKAEGNADKLCGIIQERSGEQRAEIERKLDYKNYGNQ